MNDCSLTSIKILPGSKLKCPAGHMVTVTNESMWVMMVSTFNEWRKRLPSGRRTNHSKKDMEERATWAAALISLRDQAVVDTPLDKGTLNATLKEEYLNNNCRLLLEIQSHCQSKSLQPKDLHLVVEQVNKMSTPHVALKEREAGHQLEESLDVANFAIMKKKMEADKTNVLIHWKRSLH